MNPHLHQHVKDIDRSFIKYRQDQERLTEDIVIAIKNKMIDILDYIVQAYPFRNDYGSRLKDTVMFQMDLVVGRRRDLNHKAIQDLRHNPNIDWFAEPFFGARKLQLSTLLNEYDLYRYDRSRRPGADCASYFVVEDEYDDPARDGHDERSHGEDNSVLYDRVSPDSRPASRVHQSPEDADSEPHYKRQRRADC